MWSDIIVFAIAVVSHWQGYVTGGAVTGLVALVERLSGWTMPKKVYAALYVGVFLLVSFFLAWREQYRAALTVPALQAQLQDRDNTIADLKQRPQQPVIVMPPNAPTQGAYVMARKMVISPYEIGKYVALSSECINVTNITADDVSCIYKTYVVPVDSRYGMVLPQDEEKAFNQFRKEIALANFPIPKYTFGPQQGNWGTGFGEILTSDLDRSIRAKQKALLLAIEMRWTDPTGKHANDACSTLQPEYWDSNPPFGAQTQFQNEVWRLCVKNNTLRY
jgi:hypothetical protein